MERHYLAQRIPEIPKVSLDAGADGTKVAGNSCAPYLADSVGRGAWKKTTGQRSESGFWEVGQVVDHEARGSQPDRSTPVGQAKQGRYCKCDIRQPVLGYDFCDPTSLPAVLCRQTFSLILEAMKCHLLVRQVHIA